jgi:hypothetical protein
MADVSEFGVVCICSIISVLGYLDEAGVTEFYLSNLSSTAYCDCLLFYELQEILRSLEPRGERQSKLNKLWKAVASQRKGGKYRTPLWPWP